MRGHRWRYVLEIIGWAAIALIGIGALCMARADESRPVTTRPSDTATARNSWGMTEVEWARYEQLMSGPRGRWSPDLDPLMVLGIHAESDAERRRYAERVVRQEHDRVARELEFQREYDAAWRRLYPDEQRLDPARLMADAGDAGGPPFAAGDRLLVFVDLACTDACASVVERVMARLQATPGVYVDFYLRGTNGRDDAIRQWAQARKIAPDLVRARTVTLNHDAGALARIVGADDLLANPAKYRQGALLFRQRGSDTAAVDPAVL